MTGMHPLLGQGFSLLCGQNPDHIWAPGQVPLPFCQRCTGLYVGAFVCLLLHWALRPRQGNRFVALHCLFLVIAAPFGFHLIPDGPVLRAMTGVLCGFGIGTFLWLVPATARGVSEAPTSKSAGALYALGLGATLLLLPPAARFGGVVIGCALQWLAATGAIALGGLTIANLAFGLRGFVRSAGVLLTSRSSQGAGGGYKQGRHTRTSLLLLVAVACLAASACAAPPSDAAPHGGPPKKSQPNLVVIMEDQLDYMQDPHQLRNAAESPAQEKTLNHFRALMKKRMAALDDTFEASTWYRDHWTQDRNTTRVR